MSYYPDLCTPVLDGEADPSIRDIDVTDSLFADYEVTLYEDLDDRHMMHLFFTLDEAFHVRSIVPPLPRSFDLKARATSYHNYAVRRLPPVMVHQDSPKFMTLSSPFPLHVSTGHNDFLRNAKRCLFTNEYLDSSLDLDVLTASPLSQEQTYWARCNQTMIPCAFPLALSRYYSSFGFPCMDLQFYYRDNLPLIKGSYSGLPVVILVDTGSSNNLIPFRWWKSLPPDLRPYLHRAPHSQTCATGGSPIQMLGHVHICLTADDALLAFTAIVVDTAAPFDVVLGNPFFHDFDVSMHYSRQCMTLSLPIIPLVPDALTVIPSLVSEDLKFSLYVPQDFRMEYMVNKEAIVWQLPGPLSVGEYPRPFLGHFVNNAVLFRVENCTDFPKYICPSKPFLFMDLRSKNTPFPLSTSSVKLYSHEVVSPLPSYPVVETIFAGEKPPNCAEPFLRVVDEPLVNPKSILTAESVDPYPWLDKDDPRRHMTDSEILHSKLQIEACELTQEEKKDFLEALLKQKEVFSLRLEIGECPYIEVHLQIKDSAHMFVRPYRIAEEYKPTIDREMDRLEKLGVLEKGHASFCSPVLLVPRKNEKLVRVVTDFRVLNSRLVKINHAFPLLFDSLVTLGSLDADTLSLVDIRDAFHSLRLSKESQQFCGVIPYYGSPTYRYVRMGMGLATSPAIWQQFVDIIFSRHSFHKNLRILMDDVLMLSRKEDHMAIILETNQILIDYGLKLSPHKCEYFRKQLTYLGLQFMIIDGHPHVTPLRKKVDQILNLKPPTSAKEVRMFCGMVNFLSLFLPRLRELLIPLYELTGTKRSYTASGKYKKSNVPFNWTPACQEAFDKVKALLVDRRVLALPKRQGMFRLESDTSQQATGACLYQQIKDVWRVVGFHSKRLPLVVKNYSITELELTGLLINIHGFKQLLKNRHFQVVMDHKAVEYIMKSKDEPVSARLKNLLYHLREYSFDLQYVKGKDMVVSDALSRLEIMDPTPLDSVIPISFLLHTDSYFPILRPRKSVSYKETRTYRRSDAHKPPSTPAITVTPPIEGAAVATPQSSLGVPSAPLSSLPLIEKPRVLRASLPFVPPVVDKALQQTAATSATPASTIRPPDPHHLLETAPLFNPASKAPKVTSRIPKQDTLNQLLQTFRKKVMQTWRVPWKLQDLVQAYPTDPNFGDIYKYLRDGTLPGGKRAQRKVQKESDIYAVIDDALFRIFDGITPLYPNEPTLLLVIPRSFELAVLDQYHSTLFGGHHGVWKTFLTMRRDFYMHNMINKIRNFILACHRCQETGRPPGRSLPKRPRIPLTYSPFDRCSCDIKYMPLGFDDYKYLLVVTCEITNYVRALPMKSRDAKTIAELLYHKVYTIFDGFKELIVDEDRALTGTVIEELMTHVQGTLKTISPYNHGSSKTEERIKALGNFMKKVLDGTGKNWPLWVSSAAHAINGAASAVLGGFSPFELVFVRKPPNLLSLSITPIPEFADSYGEYMSILQARLAFQKSVILKLRTDQTLQRFENSKRYDQVIKFNPGDMVKLFAPHASSLQTNTEKIRRDFIGPLVVVRRFPDDTYLLKYVLTGDLLRQKYPIVRIGRWNERDQDGVRLQNEAALYEAASRLS